MRSGVLTVVVIAAAWVSMIWSRPLQTWEVYDEREESATEIEYVGNSDVPVPIPDVGITDGDDSIWGEGIPGRLSERNENMGDSINTVELWDLWITGVPDTQHRDVDRRSDSRPRPDAIREVAERRNDEKSTATGTQRAPRVIEIHPPEKLY